MNNDVMTGRAMLVLFTVIIVAAGLIAYGVLMLGQLLQARLGGLLG